MSIFDTATDSLSQAVQALLAHWQQTNRLITISVPGVAALAHAALMPETLQGIEALSPMQRDDICYPHTTSQAARQALHEVHGFHFTLTALSADAHLNLADCIGQAALIELQTQHSREERRPWHGLISSGTRVGANGGLARYELTLSPWLFLLGLRRDSFVFNNLAVFEILDSVFTDYQVGPAGAHVQWRYDITDRSRYATHSITTQYQETDLQFITRLLAEEGLYYYFEHTRDGHTLVITDGTTQASEPCALRFTQSSASLKEDSIDRWQTQHQVLPNRVELQSWDYRTLSSRAVNSSSDAPATLSLQLEPGAYAYADVQQGQRLADNVLQAFNARRQVIQGRSTVRTLSPAMNFTLIDHYQAGTTPSAVIAIAHTARNNVDVKLGKEGSVITNLLGQVKMSSASASSPLPVAPRSRDSEASGEDQGEGNSSSNNEPVEHYRNHFSAIAANTAYRPLSQWHGKALYPKPTAYGTQTAIVVGQDDNLHTDRDHRVQIQYHWQRGANSSSALTHPSDADNARGQSHGLSGGLWVRVATFDAGDNYGSVFIPRVGQEVIVSFLGNDIDRPIVVGAVYNGQGAADAQYNQVAQGNVNATGNAPAWFAGEQGAHAHNAVLSGIKTQAVSSSQSGQGGYNQLVFDDTPGHAGLRLQTTQHHSQLNLGSLWHQQDNQRQANRGYGAELTTGHSGALRGGSGVLISSDAASLSTEQLHSNALSPLHQAQSNATALNQHAIQQHAALTGFDAKQFDEQLIKQLSDKLTTTNTGSSNSPLPVAGEGQGERVSSASPMQAKAIGGGMGEVIAYSHPVMVLSSPAGIAHFSAKDTLEVTGQHRFSSAADSSLTVQGNSLTHSAEGQVWYTAGQAPANPRAITEVGMKLHAATGNVQLRALTSTCNLNADQSILIASTQGQVKLSAPSSQLMLTAGGAAITLQQGKLTLTAPGNLTLSGAQVIYTDAQSASDQVSLAMPGAYNGVPSKVRELLPYEIEIKHSYHDLEALQNTPYMAILPDGSTRSGMTDGEGVARLVTPKPGPIQIQFKPDQRDYAVKAKMDNPDYKATLAEADMDALFAEHGGVA